MKSFKKLHFLFALCFVAIGLATTAQAHEAKVVKVTGQAYVQLPGATTSQPLAVGSLVPEGALITTSDNGQVFLETHPGQVAAIEKQSSVLVEKLALVKQGDVVTSQEALLDLKRGSIISTLDPTKKNINHYGVRTPKGVAAARGTVYGVTVNFTGGTSVATLSGSVSIDLGNGQMVSIPIGEAILEGSETAIAIQTAIAGSNQEGLTLAQLLQEAVEVVAANVAANTSAAGDANTATAVLASVVNVATAAAPEQATQFVQTAVAAASLSTAATASNVTAAVAAITEAAVRANSTAVTQISQTATQTVVQTKVQEAVEQARASGGDVNQAVAAATDAAGDLLQSIALAAMAATNASADSAAAVAIINAVNQGSATGAAAVTQQQAVEVVPPAIVTPPASATETGNPPVPDSTPIVTPPTEVVLPPVSPSGADL